MVQVNNRYIKFLHTRAKRARNNASVIREMAEKPHNALMRALLLDWADKDEARAKAAEARIQSAEREA